MWLALWVGHAGFGWQNFHWNSSSRITYLVYQWKRQASERSNDLTTVLCCVVATGAVWKKHWKYVTEWNFIFYLNLKFKAEALWNIFQLSTALSFWWYCISINLGHVRYYWIIRYYLLDIIAMHVYFVLFKMWVQKSKNCKCGSWCMYFCWMVLTWQRSHSVSVENLEYVSWYPLF